MQFLGDAVLDVLITRHIFRTYRTLSPGRLHDLRSASVNNERLAACAAVGLHVVLRHWPAVHNLIWIAATHDHRLEHV